MAIELNRDEILSLMRDLPVAHFLQERLVNELVVLNHASAINTDYVTLEDSYVDQKPIMKVDGRPPVSGRFTLEAIDTEDEPVMAHRSEDAEVVSPIMQQCKHQTYGYQCRKESTNEYCEDHLGKMCVHKDENGVMCGKQSDHGCPLEYAFVCGFPCCPDHNTCGNCQKK